MLVTKLDDINLIPGTHKAEKENWLPETVSWPPHGHHINTEIWGCLERNSLSCLSWLRELGPQTIRSPKSSRAYQFGKVKFTDYRRWMLKRSYNRVISGSLRYKEGREEKERKGQGQRDERQREREEETDAGVGAQSSFRAGVEYATLGLFRKDLWKKLFWGMGRVSMSVPLDIPWGVQEQALSFIKVLKYTLLAQTPS